MKLSAALKALAGAGCAFALLAAPAAAQPIAAQLAIRADQPGPEINRAIYGQFAEHLGYGVYGGVWVGTNSRIPNTRGYRTDVLEAIRALRVPVLRWPGGCFADEYHWRDGIGPRNRRPVTINTSWGGVEESNEFGTHEFFDFAELIGADAYLNINVGTGTPEEMMDWIEYITSETNSELAQLRRRNGRAAPWRLPYIGIGNETWGCGGTMRPEYSADLHRHYVTFIRGLEGRMPVRIASGGAGGNTNWTEVLMAQARGQMDALTLHYYTLPTGRWDVKGPGVGFDETQWITTLQRTLRMQEILVNHTAIMDRHDPEKRVGLYVDEWGTWYDPEPGTNPAFLVQPNTLRDALVAAVNFNIFHAHADRVRMTNIAQMVNVLQAMIQTEQGGANRMVLTPTYHVFQMYIPFQGATSLPITVNAPPYRHGDISIASVHASAARGTDGAIYVALTNLDPDTDAEVSATLQGAAAANVTGRILTADALDARNTFDAPNTLTPALFTGARLAGAALNVSLPAKSVVVLRIG